MTTPTPPDMPELKRYKTAREILKDVVGLSWDNETATITMTPDSFVRCIDRASRPTPPADAMPQKSTSDTIEIRRHAGNPKLVRIKGLRVVEMPECEGGGYAITGDIAERIVTALNPAPVTDAQREAGADLEGAIEHFDHLDLLFMRIAKAHKEGKPSGVNILSAFREFCESQSWQTIRAALSAPVAQVDVEKLKREVCEAVYTGAESPEDTQDIAFRVINHITAHYHLTPKTQSEE